MAGQPAAFTSYARFDDQHDDGQLTAFRERLAAEVRMHTGEKFVIFQDRTDIAWGENWQQLLPQPPLASRSPAIPGPRMPTRP